MTTVLITGAAGFIGSHLTKYLLQTGYDVTGIDISTPADARGQNFYTLDLQTSQAGEIIGKLRPDFCIHCAGPASVANSLAFPENDFRLAVLPTFNILNAVKEQYQACRFIYLSSAAVYGNPSRLPVSEDAPLQPISPYGFHKLHAENLCREFFQLYQLPISIVRIFSAYGPGLQKQLLWDLCRKAQQGGVVELHGTGLETRDFVHIYDVAQAVRLIMEGQQDGFQTYNVANGKQTKISDLASELLAHFPDVTGLSFNGQSRAGDPLYWVADISRINSLGYKQQTDLKEGVSTYVKWFRQCG